MQLFPSFEGAHNWFPMSFSPRTGLVYLPVTEMGASYSQKGIDPALEADPALGPVRGHRKRGRRSASGLCAQLAHRMGSRPCPPGLDDRDAGCAQQRHPRDCRRPRVPGTGRWAHPCLCGRRRPTSLDLRRGNRRARYADHLQRRRAPVRRHAVRPVARLGRRIRFRVGAVRLECARASAAAAGVRARCEREPAADAAAEARRSDRRTRILGRPGEGAGRARAVFALPAVPRARGRGGRNRTRPACVHDPAFATTRSPRSFATAASSHAVCRSSRSSPIPSSRRCATTSDIGPTRPGREMAGGIA